MPGDVPDDPGSLPVSVPEVVVSESVGSGAVPAGFASIALMPCEPAESDPPSSFADEVCRSPSTSASSGSDAVLKSSETCVLSVSAAAPTSAAGLADYHRHHCGYIVSIGFPPSWAGGSKVVGLAPGSELELKIGMTFHAHSWFTNTDVVDYFISNTVLLGEDGAEVLTCGTPETLIVR